MKNKSSRAKGVNAAAWFYSSTGFGSSSPSFPTAPKTPPSVWFDYANQCWVKDGKVAQDGHQTPLDGCYACAHAGETADPSHYEAD